MIVNWIKTIEMNRIILKNVFIILHGSFSIIIYVTKFIQLNKAVVFTDAIIVAIDCSIYGANIGEY